MRVFLELSSIYICKDKVNLKHSFRFGAFHICVEHCIGKFAIGSGLDDALKQSKDFAVKAVDSVLNCTR